MLASLLLSTMIIGSDVPKSTIHQKELVCSHGETNHEYVTRITGFSSYRYNDYTNTWILTYTDYEGYVTKRVVFTPSQNGKSKCELTLK